MGRKKKNLPLLEEVTILDAGSEGKAVARVNDKVLFVPYAVPGDVVDVQVTRKKNSYMLGNVVKVRSYSSKRTDPRCEHFGVCGGCKWQNMKYEEQLFYKQKQVEDNLTRLGNFEMPEVRPILRSEQEFFYRNKLEFTFLNRKWLKDFSRDINFSDLNMNGIGFHVKGMHDRIVDLENCYLQPEPSNAIRLEARKFSFENSYSFYDIKKKEGFLRNLLIRNTSTGDLMVLLVVGQDDKASIAALLDHLEEKFAAITSLMYVVNTKVNDIITDLDIKLYKGLPYITEQMEDIKFRIGPVSFFQTNTTQSYELYKLTREFAGLTGNETVYDLYSGTGTIGLFLSGKAKKVVGVEYVEAAVEDAKVNAEINQVTNADFFAGDLAVLLNEEFASSHGHPDVVITDPPRAGMHEKVVKQLIKIAPSRIVYVSCNPATQARDVTLLSEAFDIKAIQPVDMFPHTHHVENVMLLEKK